MKLYFILDVDENFDDSGADGPVLSETIEKFKGVKACQKVPLGIVVAQLSSAQHAINRCVKLVDGGPLEGK